MKGPYKPFAVFHKVGKHYYAFLGTYQYETPERAIYEARRTYPLGKRDRLVAFPWHEAVIRDGKQAYSAEDEVF